MIIFQDYFILDIEMTSLSMADNICHLTTSIRLRADVITVAFQNRDDGNTTSIKHYLVTNIILCTSLMSC